MHSAHTVGLGWQLARYQAAILCLSCDWRKVVHSTPISGLRWPSVTRPFIVLSGGQTLFLLRLALDCARSWPGMAVWPTVRRPYIDLYCASCHIVHSAHASGLSSGTLPSSQTNLVVSIPFWPSGHWPHYIITCVIYMMSILCMTLHVHWAGFGSAASTLSVTASNCIVPGTSHTLH